MARYNTKSVSQNRTTTHEGAVGFKHDIKFELINMLANDFGNTFYEKLSDREKRLADVIKELAEKDPEFVAKALIYTRSVIGQRSVTHFASAVLVPYLSGSALGKRFFSKRSRKENKGGVVYRIDDMLEILAAYWLFNPDAPIPNSMRKGFRTVMENADTYELAKYQAKKHGISLVDVMRLVRPNPSEEMAPVFKSLADGSLKQFNTVEDKNSASGQEVAKKVREGKITKEEAVEELKEVKASNFKELIFEKKIGYLALLRNLRNICNASTDKQLMTASISLLTDEKFIRKSLVFPHQIDLALEVLMHEGSVPNNIVNALNKAYELAIPNLSEAFPEGKTAVLIDTSGSMGSGWSSKIYIGPGKTINKTPVEKAALIGATLVKGIGADMYMFASSTRKMTYNPGDTINTIKRDVTNSIGIVGHGTDFAAAAKTLGSKYDRVFVISDMQTQTYLGKGFQNNPYTYLINLCGYSQGAINTNGKLDRIFNLAGYSKDIYELAKKMEIDPKALLKEIEAIQI